MTCAHHWRVESPRDARLRWEADDALEHVYLAQCAKCGAERTYAEPEEPSDYVDFASPAPLPEDEQWRRRPRIERG